MDTTSTVKLFRNMDETGAGKDNLPVTCLYDVWREVMELGRCGRLKVILGIKYDIKVFCLQWREDEWIGNNFTRKVNDTT